jgi:hypothetical protein
VAAAFDPDGGGAGRGNQINLAAFGLLIWLFDPKLKEIPPPRVSSGAVEMGTEELRCKQKS